MTRTPDLDHRTAATDSDATNRVTQPAEPHHHVVSTRDDWWNGLPFTVTAAHVASSWDGYRDGRTFRCHMCGEFFKAGDRARFVWVNGVKAARDAGVHCGNVMVCDACDGPDVYTRLAEHERHGQKRYWSLMDRDRLPKSPHSPHPRQRKPTP